MFLTFMALEHNPCISWSSRIRKNKLKSEFHGKEAYKVLKSCQILVWGLKDDLKLRGLWLTVGQRRSILTQCLRTFKFDKLTKSKIWLMLKINYRKGNQGEKKRILLIELPIWILLPEVSRNRNFIFLSFFYTKHWNSCIKTQYDCLITKKVPIWPTYTKT